MSSIKRITIIAIVVAIVALGLWDIAAAAFGGASATISDVMAHAAKHNPIVPFAAGVLCGHWFWQLKRPRHTPGAPM